MSSTPASLGPGAAGSVDAGAMKIVADLRTPATPAARGTPCARTASAAASRKGRSLALPRSFRSKGRSVMSGTLDFCSRGSPRRSVSSPRRSCRVDVDLDGGGVDDGDAASAQVTAVSLAFNVTRGVRIMNPACGRALRARLTVGGTRDRRSR